VVAEVMFVDPLTVNPDAVTFPADRVTPPITEFAAEIVELIMETPAIELLMVDGVEMDPLVVIVILVEKKFELVSDHAAILFEVSSAFEIRPLFSVTFPILFDVAAPVVIFPTTFTFEPTLRFLSISIAYALTV